MKQKIVKACVITASLFSFITLAEETSKAWDFKVSEANTKLSLLSDCSGKPVIIWKDSSQNSKPVEAVEIGGISLGKRILSGSEFRLYPNRICEWDYDFGFRVYSPEDFNLSLEEKAKLVKVKHPFVKRLYDPLKPFTQIRPYPNQLSMYLKPGREKLVYPLDFGTDFKAVGLQFKLWWCLPDGTGAIGSASWRRKDKNGKYSLKVTVSSDPEGKKIITSMEKNDEELTGMSEFGRIDFPLPEISKFYVHLEMTAGELCIFSGSGMRVFLRYSGKKPWPEIKSGENRIAYSEAGSLRGEREINFSLPDTILLPNFTGGLEKVNLHPHSCQVEKVIPVSPDDSFLNNTGYIRLKQIPGIANWVLSVEIPQNAQDWSNVKAVRVVYRTPTWTGRVQFNARAVYGDKTHPRFMSFGAAPIIPVPRPRRPIPQWKICEKILPGNWEDRHRVTSVVLSSWGPSWNNDKEEQPFSLEIGALELVPYAPNEKEKIVQEAQKRKQWDESSKNNPLTERLDKLPLPAGKRINPRDVFLRGFWGAPVGGDHYAKGLPGCTNNWDFILKVIEDFKKNNLNAAHFEIFNFNEKNLERFVKLADENGMYLWGCYSLLTRLPAETAPLAFRRKAWDKQMVNWRKLLEKYKNCPTFLAWAVGEEPYKYTLPYIQQSREVIKEVGAQPQIMIYNNAENMLKDCETPPLPGGAAYDSYVFLTIGKNPQRYLGVLETTWKAVKKCGGVLWMTPQMVGQESGHGTVYLSMSQGEMRFQIWTAIAYNCKGFFPWKYLTGAKKPDHTDTSYFRYYAEEMGRLAVLEKVLIAMERDDELTLLSNKDEKLLIGNFKDRNQTGDMFAVVVNLDLESTREFIPVPRDEEHEVQKIFVNGTTLTATDIDGKIRLAPGDGVILRVGKKIEAPKIIELYSRKNE